MKSMLSSFRSFSLACFVVVSGFAYANEVAVGAGDGTKLNITTNTTWSASNTYILQAQVFVKSGVTLTIEPGTVIKANNTDGADLAPAIIVEQGGFIIADGTKDKPITFTANQTDAVLKADPRGHWGGLIINGYAPLAGGGTSFVEGVTGVPYGGTNASDSSGVLRYVRIWHGGRSIGQDNEINGLTLAGVGNKTVVDYVEVAYNKDDGFEMFGGTVNLRHCTALWVGDDGFDTDEGYTGKGQFLLTIQGTQVSGRAYEMDSKFESKFPRSYPQFANSTIIGPGNLSTAPTGEGADEAVRLREGTAGNFWNHLVTNVYKVGVAIKDSSTAALMAKDSLVWSANNIVYGGTDRFKVGGNATVESGDTTSRNVDPLLAAITDVTEFGTATFDPRPSTAGPAFLSADNLPNDGFFNKTSYVGAFGRNLWIRGWSVLDSRLPAETTVDLAGNIASDSTLVSTKSYRLTGQVFVKSGATLTIQPGVTIKALPDDGNGLAPALIIEQGAKIMAEGTLANPITFTSILSSAELAASPRGNWGGIIVNGKAPLAGGGTKFVEGVTGVPYGGTDPTDNSGVLKYVRIWHGGKSIGQDNEINGLTLAGVGNKTIVDYVEVAHNLDDGFEMFGGTVNLRHCSALWVGDDGFDTDEGYTGKGQFLFAVQGEQRSGRNYEMDSKFDSKFPRSMPQFANVTLLGPGSLSNPPSGEGADENVRLREGTAGMFWNHLVTNIYKVGVAIKDSSTAALLANDSLVWSANNIVYGGTDRFKVGGNATVSASDTTSRNVDPQLLAVTNTSETGGVIDPRPKAGSPAFKDADTLPNDGFFSQVNYVGAFGTNLWLKGWSYLSDNGRLPSAGANIVELGAGSITTNTTWDNTNEYLLTGQVFVKSGATLTIQPGVTIKALPDDGNGLAPALIIEQGAKIMAEGTLANPITFTSILSSAELAASPRGNWGGIIVNGKAPLAGGGTKFVEGITGVPYGGTDPEDNSGTLKYVRVWHGGRSIGQDNEINGITLAGVGSKTTVEYCEVAYNLDDGFEMFGGTVNLKYCSALYVGDDGFDTDEGYIGKGQFLFVIQGDQRSGRAYEMDSKFDTKFPRSMPQFANATLIGPGTPSTPPAGEGADEAVRLREGTAGMFWNHIVSNIYKVGVAIKDSSTAALLANDSLIWSANNIVYGGTDRFKVGGNAIVSASDTTSLNEDPLLAMISDVSEDGTAYIDPRPLKGGPAYKNADTLPSDGFFTQVDYVGAFGETNWLDKWSILSAQGRLGVGFLSVDDDALLSGLPSSFELQSNYPNPFNPSTKIRFGLPNQSEVTVTIYNLLGEQVMQYDMGVLQAGFKTVTWHGKNSFGAPVPSGMYLYRVNAGNEFKVGKMTLMK